MVGGGAVDAGGGSDDVGGVCSIGKRVQWFPRWYFFMFGFGLIRIVVAVIPKRSSVEFQ